MKPVVAIVQARMGSTRLPGKTLMDLGGATVMQRVLERLARATLVSGVVVAITDRAEDDVLEAHLGEIGATCVRGSSDDVLSRFGVAALASPASAYLRITADCPLIDWDVVDGVIGSFQDSGVDYCSNVLRRTYPLGMDCEVFSAEALELALGDATLPHEREHVTPFMYQHPERFRLHNVDAPDWATWPELRLTVDEQKDLEFVRAIVSEVGPHAGLRPIVELLEGRQDLLAINDGVPHRHVEKPTNW